MYNLIIIIYIHTQQKYINSYFRLFFVSYAHYYWLKFTLLRHINFFPQLQFLNCYSFHIGTIEYGTKELTLYNFNHFLINLSALLLLCSQLYLCSTSSAHPESRNINFSLQNPGRYWLRPIRGYIQDGVVGKRHNRCRWLRLLQFTEDVTNVVHGRRGSAGHKRKHAAVGTRPSFTLII